MSGRESFADQGVPTRGAQDTPYPTFRQVARQLALHLCEYFVGEVLGRGADEVGLDSERAADIAVPGVLTYVSSAAGDTTQTLTVYGLDGSGDPASESVLLTGDTPITGAQTFSSVLAATLSAAAVGTVTAKDGVPTTLFSLAAGDLTKGYAPEDFAADGGVLVVSVDTDDAGEVAVVLGLNAAGDPVVEAFALDTANTTPVVGSELFATVTAVLLGGVAAARTVTVTPEVSTLAGLPFEPAIVDFYDPDSNLELRMLPGSAGAHFVDLTDGTAATPDISVGATSVTLPRDLVLPGHTVSVVCVGVRSDGGGL